MPTGSRSPNCGIDAATTGKALFVHWACIEHYQGYDDDRRQAMEIRTAIVSQASPRPD
jgi:hypothetical protein